MKIKMNEDKDEMKIRVTEAILIVLSKVGSDIVFLTKL